jgi:hypothetical protein
MSSLPNPTQFKAHKQVFKPAQSKPYQKKDYDINTLDIKFKVALTSCDEVHYNALGNKLINWTFWSSCPNKNAGVKYFGYSPKDNSLTIHLYNDNGEIQTIAIRESGATKWKTYGSKKYMPYDIKDDIVFIHSGMSEIIISELLGLSFIGLQSDSMVQHLPAELKELTRDKFIVVLSDNDESFRKIIPFIKEFFQHSKTIIINFEHLLKKELPKGFDFRDFVNEIGNAPKVLSMLEDEILRGGSNV